VPRPRVQLRALSKSPFSWPALALVDPRSVGLLPERKQPLARAAPVVLLVACLLAVWLVWSPRSGDLAAQAYRVHLFELNGFSLWDDNWYAGHYLPAYSLLVPALASLIGLHWVGVAAVIVSTYSFSRLAAMRFGARATPATLLFAVSAAGDAFIGRIAFATGVSLALLAVLAEVRSRHAWAAFAALASAAASPVAGLFLLIAAITDLVSSRRASRAILLGIPAVATIGTLAIMFPEGGQEPFGLPSLLAACGAAVALLVFLPASERLLRCGTWLYLGCVLACYAIPSPVGSNSARLGVLFAPAIFAGAIDVTRVAAVLSRCSERLARARRLTRAGARLPNRGVARGVFAATLLALVLWQIDGPITDSVQASSDPSTRPAYYLPLIEFLDRHSRPEPMRLEVPFTDSHWDAAILAGHFELARGWERQLDTRYDSLFYSNRLSASAYHAWLLNTGVRFVALSDAPLDYSSRQEAELIRTGLPFLGEVFADRHWRVYEVRGARPLASGPGRLTAIGSDSFRLLATAAGRFLVRIHYTSYWHISLGAGSISEAPAGWTYVTSAHAGQISVVAEL
jgi:hypothetical protein